VSYVGLYVHIIYPSHPMLELENQIWVTLILLNNKMSGLCWSLCTCLSNANIKKKYAKSQESKPNCWLKVFKLIKVGV